MNRFISLINIYVFLNFLFDVHLSSIYLTANSPKKLNEHLKQSQIDFVKNNFSLEYMYDILYNQANILDHLLIQDPLELWLPQQETNVKPINIIF